MAGFTEKSSAVGTLNDHHLHMLQKDSGISADVIKARGYFTATTKTRLRDLGFSSSQQRVPALVIPVHDVHGALANYQIRPDDPRVIKGRTCKYEMPLGSKMVLDVPPSVRQYIGDAAKPLFLTEGLKKADAIASRDYCVIGLIGVWNFRGTNDAGGKVVLADFESVALNDRQTTIVFDSDVMTNRHVYQALVRLKAFLESRQAKVSLVYLPATDGGGKQGVDDFLVANHSINDVFALATTKLKAPPQDERELPYEMTDSGIVWHKRTGDGEVAVPLTNFSAEIVSDIIVDDGAEQHREFMIEAKLNGRQSSFNILSSAYAGMNWATAELGADAALSPGFSIRDHARYAIQKLSAHIERRTIYTHLGWRKIEGAWVYLHAGGQIGQVGQVCSEGVEVGTALARYTLPAPPGGDELCRAIQKSMACLDVAPRGVTIPLYGCIWRAVLDSGDFSAHLVGPTGHGKTTLAALLQQHFGADMDAQHLPANWSGTDNALEGIAFTAKDALLVIDEFTPADAAHSQALHRKAERLFRGQANRTGRHRMNSDTTLRPDKVPRGLILSTGEDVPRGMSLRARMLIIELEPDTVKFDKLTACQADAADGVYAQAMAGFIHWLCPYIDRIKEGWRDDLAELRQKATTSDMHRRTPENIASLMLGWLYFLRFAEASGVITEGERMEKEREVWETLGRVAQSQSQHIATAEPAARFLALLQNAIASEKAYLKEWRPEATLQQESKSGVCVGWDDTNGNLVYLLPDASFAAAQELGQKTADSLVVSPRTLWKRLHEKGHVAETEGSRETYMVRKTLDGRRTGVLPIYRGSLFQKPDQPDQPDQSAKSGEPTPELEPIGQVLPDQWSGHELLPDHGNALNYNEISPIGQVGQAENITEAEYFDRARAGSLSGQVLRSDLTNGPTKPDQSEEMLDAGDGADAPWEDGTYEEF